MFCNNAINDYTPQQVLWALTLKNGARSYSSDTKAYNEIRDYAFNSSGWCLTPKGPFTYNTINQEQINRAPAHMLMDAILNACECFSENTPNDDRTFMEVIASSMNGISERYTITGKRII